jgi:hypothetical protein
METNDSAPLDTEPNDSKGAWWVHVTYIVTLILSHLPKIVKLFQ